VFNIHIFSGKNYYLEHENQGVVIINGTINGDIIGAEDVIVTSTGSCDCNINAKNLIIDGTVKGNIDVETLIIDSGKLYYDRIRMDKLLISEQGFIAHKSDVETEKIPDNFVFAGTEESTSKYEKLTDKIGVNLKHFRLYLNNSDNNEQEYKQKTEQQQQSMMVEDIQQNDMRPNIESNNSGIIQEFYSSF